MSKILITGNGFDLFHHLPTKYGHFMAIMETIEDCDVRGETSIEDLFEYKFKANFEIDYELIKANYNTREIVFDAKMIKEISEKLKTNTWYKHFKRISDLVTWIDFESEIENVLHQVSEILNYTSEKSTIRQDSFSNKKLNLYIDFTVFNFCVSDGIDSFFFNKNYINKRTEKLDGKKLLEELSNSLDDFICIFNMYLVAVVSEFYKKINQNYLLPIQNIKEIYTFNYTPTLESIYGIDSGNVTYLHGKINKNEEIQNIILGVSDLNEILESHKMYNFSKLYQKVRKETNYRFIHIPKTDGSIAEQKLFYILGHSLDKSDKEYIKDLFKYLKVDSHMNSEIIIFFRDKNDYNSKLKNLFSIMGKDIIVETNKANRLRFVEITEYNVLLEFKRDTKKRVYSI